MTAIRRSMRWEGSIGPGLIANLAGAGTGHQLPTFAFEQPVEWALDVLGIVEGNEARPPRHQIQQRFRILLREAHPDHGGVADDAAQRIADLREARRILLT
jgi:hypothetical protein